MVLDLDAATEINPFAGLEPGAETAGEQYYALRATALGTTCNVTFSAANRHTAHLFREQAGNWLGSFEQRYSRFRADSMISQINRDAADQPVAIDEELDSLFKLCDWFHWTTKGLFDPTMMPLNDLWGFTADAAHRPATPPSAEAVAATLTQVGWRKIERSDTKQVRFTQPGMALDMGGIGKEYAVDRVAEMALALGIRNCLVDFGHDVRAHGSPPEGGPWRIGLENPDEPGCCTCGIALTNKAVATSGNYLRYREYGGERFGHLIDPRTGYPVQTDCLSTSVIAPTCTEAGVLASCSFILGSDEATAWMRSFHQVTGCCSTDRGMIRFPGFERIEIAQQPTTA